MTLNQGREFISAKKDNTKSLSFSLVSMRMAHNMDKAEQCSKIKDNVNHSSGVHEGNCPHRHGLTHYTRQKPPASNQKPVVLCSPEKA